MVKSFVEYNFNTETVKYPTTYDPTKLNLGYLMKKSVDSNGKTYVSPLDPTFIRCYEISNETIGSLSSLKYNDNITWLFYTNPGSVNTVKRIFLAEYNFDTNSLTQLGSIYSSLINNSNHDIRGLRSSLDLHTGGTISVSFSGSVSGVGTTWLTDGVCAGNRIGFGSTNPSEITTWYEVLAVSGNTSLFIKRGVTTDGDVTNLYYPPGTPYVVEDLRIFYGNYAGASNTVRGLFILKGLRKEIFNSTITSVNAATTIDNQRATYRLTDSASIANFSPLGFVLGEKISLSEQYGYLVSYCGAGGCSSTSIQKFNVRKSLTGLTSSRSDAAYLLSTGVQSTSSPYSNTYLFDPITNDNGNIYLTQTTRISRIPMTAVTASSTNFITGQMVENPPGGTNTFALSNTMENSIFLPTVNRVLINNQSGFRSYVTPFISGSSQFERIVTVNDSIQQSSYLDFSFDYLTPHTLGTQFYSTNNSGISFLVRYITNNSNIIYALPLEADKEYSETTKAYIMTPKITTLSAVTYDKVYFDTTDTWSSGKLTQNREIFDSYYRISGIDNDSGTWTLISENGSMSGVTSSEVQFKFTFRTIGPYCVPRRLHGLTLTYSANTNPVSTTFYEPSLKYTDISSNIFSWRQRCSFESNIPNLNLEIYNLNNNNLLLTDNVNTSSNGVWQYSTDGFTWNSWASSANTVGNYIRYSASTLSATGIKIKPILYI